MFSPALQRALEVIMQPFRVRNQDSETERGITAFRQPESRPAPSVCVRMEAGRRHGRRAIGRYPVSRFRKRLLAASRCTIAGSGRSPRRGSIMTVLNGRCPAIQFHGSARRAGVR
ncbi:hypothetical protein CCS01_21555 [Rhodopila globiformis]|uniref:Uncharacterized protein n=1 Tax=Rhodopila globiformis TaxID=1071 RepID=A0A2S6N495_RHOGL|nr:hypothetical protein CCS01_21555 [Rhodopila globiformis]